MFIRLQEIIVLTLKIIRRQTPNYNKALLCSDAVECGYVWLGLGQSFYELGNMEKAKDVLMSAYMLEGKEIFEDVNEKYFNIIKDNI